MILGTLEHMAPEQLEGKKADARTDIFALGVVIFEMATGRKAFEADSKASLIAKILTFQLPAIETIQPVSPPELNAAVQKCLAKNPDERWQKAAGLASGLREVADVLPRLKVQVGQMRPGEEAKDVESKAQEHFPVSTLQKPKGSSQFVRSHTHMSLFSLALYL